MKIAVVLATYNGEDHLAELLNSILRQSRAPDRIFIRDDGSSDGTRKILADFEKKEPSIVLLPNGARLGVVGNFSESISHASEFDLIFFADQDDLWHLDKIETMERCAQKEEARYGKEMPILIHADLRLVDKEGKYIANSFWQYQSLCPKTASTLPRLLMQNSVTGAAMCMNRALAKKGLPIPREAAMHDHWYALVAALFGKIVVLDRPLVDYRQHEKNQLGAKKIDLYGFWRREWKVSLHTAQGKALLAQFSNEVDDKKRGSIEKFISLIDRPFLQSKIDLILGRFFKQGLYRNIALFLLPFTKERAKEE